MKKILLIAILCLTLSFTGCSNSAGSDIVETKESKETVDYHAGYSLDWDCVDEMYLLKIAEYHGGRVDDRAYTIRVTLNNVWDTKESIPTVVLRELYENDGISAYDFEGIFISDATLEAMKKIYIDKFDNSNGSKEFIEFYLEDLK